MNIFYTNPDPTESANEHCDIHVRKMIVESAQLLCTAHHIIDGYGGAVLYKSTHKNHPSALWVQSGMEQYKWLYQMFTRLSQIYQIKTTKIHSTWERLGRILEYAPKGISNAKFTPPTQAMPDEFKLDSDETHIAYQNYMNSKFKDWQSRTEKRKMFPTWALGRPKWANK